MLSLDPATVWVDTDHAEEAAESALASRDPAALKDALALFTGEMLPEDRYLSWTEPRRARLTALKEEMYLGLASAHLERGEFQEATAAAEHVLRASPAEEAAHRILIDACIRQGLRRRAVGQYHLCREALAAELGVPPGPETERLHRLALATTHRPGPAQVALPAPLQSPDVAPLRGRDELLRRLLTTEGAPVRILTGEAGVGKTRLVAEAARLAAASGSAVLWGAYHDAEGHTPYGVFAEALDGWLAERDVTERARVGAEYPELAAFLPSLGQVRSPGDRSPGEERDRLFRATAGLLTELATVQPVLLVLDDLHAADSGSYQLLSHLARRASRPGFPLRVLVTYRAEELADSGPRVVDLAALLRQPQIVHETVQRLDREACMAVARDVASAMGEASLPGAGPDSARRLDRVWDLSLGNPLFAGELARNLSADDPGDVAPDGVRQLVAEKLARLDGNTRRVVEALSVGGAETSLSELLDVAADGLHPPLSGAAAITALDEAIGAALIEERTVVVTGRHETGIAFRHPLVRLTCYERLSAVRRRHLHGAFAQAVRRRRPDAVDTLASHFARADDARAAEYLRLAAERAAALYANDTADRYYRDLIARLDVDAGRARLAHAQVLRSMGHFEQAVGALRPSPGRVRTAARPRQSRPRSGTAGGNAGQNGVPRTRPRHPAAASRNGGNRARTDGGSLPDAVRHPQYPRSLRRRVGRRRTRPDSGGRGAGTFQPRSEGPCHRPAGEQSGAGGPLRPGACCGRQSVGAGRGLRRSDAPRIGPVDAAGERAPRRPPARGDREGRARPRPRRTVRRTGGRRLRAGEPRGTVAAPGGARAGPRSRRGRGRGR